MEASGHGALLKEATKVLGGGSKARIGRYCGEQIAVKGVPVKHREFIELLRRLVIQ
jgi:hypothetical protein